MRNVRNERSFENRQLADGRTMIESRYHNFGLDSEITIISIYLKIPVKCLRFLNAHLIVFFRAIVKKKYLRI